MRGARLDAFILDRRLGGGGMGEVYRALHEPSGRFVALKLLTGKGRAQRQRLRRSVRLEAEALARLSHPGVVAVLDRGVVDTHADRELVPGALACDPDSARVPFAGTNRQLETSSALIVDTEVSTTRRDFCW